MHLAGLARFSNAMSNDINNLTDKQNTAWHMQLIHLLDHALEA